MAYSHKSVNGRNEKDAIKKSCREQPRQLHRETILKQIMYVVKHNIQADKKNWAMKQSKMQLTRTWRGKMRQIKNYKREKQQLYLR